MAVQLICCSHSPLMTTDVEEAQVNVHAAFFNEPAEWRKVRDRNAGTRDVGRDPARQRDQIGAETDLGNFELAMKVGALEALFDRHRDVIDVATFEADAPVDQRTHAVVIPRGNGHRQPAHRISSVGTPGFHPGYT